MQYEVIPPGIQLELEEQNFAEKENIFTLYTDQQI